MRLEARQAALAALKLVRDGCYANLAVNQVLRRTALSAKDAGFVTELVYGTCRNLGTLDLIIERAGGRPLNSLQPAVVDLLRLGAQQVLRMRLPVFAAVSSMVTLATGQIGRRVTGVVNAVLRRVAERGWNEWLDELTAGMAYHQGLAIRTCHPTWMVEVYARLLPADELVSALEADNLSPTPTLVVRPTLLSRDELLFDGGEPTPYSPWGVSRPGDPGQVAAVRDGRAGVQDEGSQLVAGLLAEADAADGTWLDLCAGPGGKAALLTGLARQQRQTLLAAELHPHRAELTVEALRAYGQAPVVVADGRVPAWGADFARILLDAPCSGLGALRRRPEARWRKHESDVPSLAGLQRDLLESACSCLVPGGVVAYVTCSPHPDETAEVVHAVSAVAPVEILDAPPLLPQVLDAAADTDPRFIQLWPHRHNTDAMFCALLRRR